MEKFVQSMRTLLKTNGNDENDLTGEAGSENKTRIGNKNSAEISKLGNFSALLHEVQRRVAITVIMDNGIFE